MLSDIGHSDVCEEESEAKSLNLLIKIKGIYFIVSTIFMNKIMYKTKMMCDALEIILKI